MYIKQITMNNTSLEYKFFSQIYSLKRSLILAWGIMILLVISLFLCILTKGESLLAIVLLIITLFCFFSFSILISRRVKISVEDDAISIYYGRKLKYRAPVSRLKEIQGIDIDNRYARSELRFLFTDRIFHFSIWELPYAIPYKQTVLLKTLVNKFQLEKKLDKRRFPFILDRYRYINTSYYTNQ